MSERPHYTSPSVASTTTTEEHMNPAGEKRNGVGASATQEFHQNHRQHSLVAPPQPHELTAEWTVRAQLTFARAGEKVRREFSSNDPLNPVRVIYKWSTLDATATSVDNDDDDDDFVDDGVETASTLRRQASSRCSGQSTPQKRPPKRHQSFRSTSSSLNAATTAGEPCVDSAFSSGPTPTSTSFKQQQHSSNSSSNVPSGSGIATAALYGGTRCRSTCNIVVSAVADFLPASANATAATAMTSDFIPEMEADPFVYNTTASYRVLPQKSFDDNSTTATTSKNFTAFGRVLALRDAFSQTSDTETRYFEQHESDGGRRRVQQHVYQPRPYEQRRSTAEGLIRPTTSSITRSSNADIEGKASMPTTSHTPTTFKSASMSRIPSLLQHQHQQQATSKHSSTDQQKKPRTVHIDVYCTGSEDDEHADAEASSSSDDDDSKRHEIDSNSTRQTVLDNEQMRLRHQRITGQSLPRRLATQQQQQKQLHQQQQQNLSSQSDLNLGHAITKSSTAEEVCESKQLLFRKHIGDQRAAKLATLRQKYLRQPSDDALSSTYPNSSHSTVRDATCSSISSTVPSVQTPQDAADSSWKETEEADDYYSIGKSDSFDYANSVDRLRIRQMEKYWSQDDDPRQQQTPYQQRSSHSPTKPHFLQTISEVNSQPSSPYRAAAAAAPSTIFQRNDTINSDLETFSEADAFNTYPNTSSTGFVPYQRQFSQPPKVLKSASPIMQQTSHFPRNRPGFLQFFGPHTDLADSTQTTPTSPLQPVTAPVEIQPSNLLYPNYQPYLQRWKSEARENLSSSITPATSEHSQHTSPQLVSSPYTISPQRCGSEAPPTTISASASASTFQHSPIVARRFDMRHESPSVSDASTVVSGYTTEYLEKARKFGNVVSTVRKPGHHVGPTKNPNCSCESCLRWMSERFQLRGRAFSLGERPILKRPTRD